MVNLWFITPPSFLLYAASFQEINICQLDGVKSWLILKLHLTLIFATIVFKMFSLQIASWAKTMFCKGWFTSNCILDKNKVLQGLIQFKLHLADSLPPPHPLNASSLQLTLDPPAGFSGCILICEIYVCVLVFSSYCISCHCNFIPL